LGQTWPNRVNQLRPLLLPEPAAGFTPGSPYLMCDRWMPMVPAEGAMPKTAVRVDLTASAPCGVNAVPPERLEIRRAWEAHVCERWLDLEAAAAIPPESVAGADLMPAADLKVAGPAWAPQVGGRQEFATVAEWLELVAAPAAPARAGAKPEVAVSTRTPRAPLPSSAWLEATSGASVESPQRSDEIASAAGWLELAAAPAAPALAGAVPDFAHAAAASAPRMPGNCEPCNGQLLPAIQRKWLDLVPSPAASASFARRVDLSPQAPRGKTPEFSCLPEARKPRQTAMRDLWQPLAARGAAPVSQGAIPDLAPGISKVLVLPVPVQAGETGLRACRALRTEAAAASPSRPRNAGASLKPFAAAPQGPAQSLVIPEPTLRTTAGWRRPAPAEIALVNVFASAQKAPEAWPAPLRLPETLPPLIVQSAGEEPPEEGGHIPLEFYCQRIVCGPARVAEWRIRAHAPARPAFTLEAALGKLDDLKRKGAAPIVFFPERSARKKFKNHIIELIAAGFLLAGIAWIGGRSAVKSSRMPDTKTDMAVVSHSGTEAAAALAAGRPGPIARLRRAIAERAVVEVSDSFQSDMSAWGHAKSWAPGWSRNPDGYVRTGQLALFEPTAKFTDYRMEFFGQIENKSIGWVVRARDKKNYYAMKFTVIAPGLRPLIAMVHYPVIGGKPGHRIETPLNVMVHNNTPYHIGVSVQGRHIITSIEGQEVDRWADDTLATGGVGFFSDPGERARLYWMKVTKNADFLGRICAYISGSPAPGAAPVAEILPIGWNYGYRYFPAIRYGN
jgi:hypothetical protein